MTGGRPCATSMPIIATMSRSGERLWPLVVAVVAGGLASVYLDHIPSPEHMATATMALGLIVAGFTETQRSVLLSMSGSKVLRFAATSGYYKDILNYLADCVCAGLFAAFVSLIGIFLGSHGMWQSVWSAFWIGSILLMILVLVRNQWLMHRVFTRFMEEQKKP